MPNWVNNTITNNGAIAIAAAIGGTQLVITRVAAGSGIASGSISSLTALVHSQLNLTPVPPQVSANNLQPGEVIVMATLDSANVGATFSLTELGVFGSSGGGPEVLIAYCQASSPYDSISTGSGSNRLQINEQIPIIVGVGASVSITVQAGNPVYVPPVIGKTGITVLSPLDSSGRVLEWDVYADPTAVLLRLPATANLFVRTTGNDSTAILNDTTHPWLTIQGALNYLANYFITTGQVAYIYVGPGYFQTPFSCNHPQGNQISIVGTLTSATATSASYVVGGTVTLNGPTGTFSGFAVGDTIAVINSETGPGLQISGCWVLTAASSTSISYYVAYGTLAAGTVGTGVLAGITSVYVLRFQTCVLITSQTYAVLITTGINISNLAIRYQGTNPANGVLGYQNSVSSFYYVGFYAWIENTSTSSAVNAQIGSNMSFTNCYFSRNSNGIVSQGGNITANSCIATNNGNGYDSQGGFISLIVCYAIGNINFGFGTQQGATIALTNCVSYYNANGGVVATTSGKILEGNGGAYYYNGGADIILSVMSLYLHTSGATAGYSTLSANITAVGAYRLTGDGCFFSP